MDFPARFHSRYLIWIVAIIVTSWVLVNASAEVIRFEKPIGAWPIRIGYDGTVVPGDSCARSPFHYPPLVDLRRTEALARVSSGVALPNQTTSVWFVGERSPVRLTASRCPAHVTVLLRACSALAGLFLALFLLARRTALPTFGFFLFVAGFSPVPMDALNAYLPDTGLVSQFIISDILQGAGLWGAAVFFEALAASNVLLRYLTLLVAIGAVACNTASDIAFNVLHLPSAALFLTSQLLVLGGVLCTTALFYGGFHASDPRTRARARWVALTFFAGVPVYLFASVVLSLPLPLPPISNTAYDVMLSSIVLVPLSTTYALLRDRLLDFRTIERQGTYAALYAAELAVGQIPIIGHLVATPMKEWARKAIEKRYPPETVVQLRSLRRKVPELARVQSFSELQESIVRSAAESLDLEAAALLRERAVVAQTTNYDTYRDALHELAASRDLRLELGDGSGYARLCPESYDGILRLFHDAIRPVVAIAVDVPGLPLHIFIGGPHRDGTDLGDAEVQLLQDFLHQAVTANIVFAIRRIERHIGLPGLYE